MGYVIIGLAAIAFGYLTTRDATPPAPVVQQPEVLSWYMPQAQEAAGFFAGLSDALGVFGGILLVLLLCRMPALRETVQPLRDRLNGMEAWLPSGATMETPGFIKAVWRKVREWATKRKEAKLEKKGFVKPDEGEVEAPPPPEHALTLPQSIALVGVNAVNAFRMAVILVCFTAAFIAVRLS